MRFFGQFVQRLDAKHRVVIPKRFRDAIGEEDLRRGLILTRGFDKCLFLLPPSQWEALAKRLAAAHFMTFQGRMLQRLFFSEAVEAVPDRLGRVVLTERLRELAGLADEALFLGASDRIEVWSPARWAALQEAHAEQLEALGEEVYRLLQGGKAN